VGSTLHSTKAVILRTVHYGDSSLIVTAYTELFGLQSYILQGIRRSSKNKTGSSCFQPGAMLDLVVYFQEFRQLHRVREYKWAHLYQSLFSDITKSSILLYMIELLQKTIRQPESNSDLFEFIEDSLLKLDGAEKEKIINFPLFFSVHLTAFFGFQPAERESSSGHILDLQEGVFTNTPPLHVYSAEGKAVESLKDLLKVRLPHELSEISLTSTVRRELLQILEQYYALHIPEFGKMRSTSILQEVLA